MHKISIQGKTDPMTFSHRISLILRGLGFLFIVFHLTSFSQTKNQYYFGFSLNPDANSGLVSFGILKITPDREKSIIRLNKRDFMLQAAGLQASLANPDTVDLFKRYNISNYYVVDSLWKLKYAEYPFLGQRQTEKGWANKDFSPSPGQFKILKHFGIEKAMDFCYGDNAFFLMRALQDPAWIARYNFN